MLEKEDEFCRLMYHSYAIKLSLLLHFDDDTESEAFLFLTYYDGLEVFDQLF